MIATRDVGDCARLALRFHAEERDHWGIILVSPRRFPASTRAIGLLVRALDVVLKAHPRDDDLVNEHMWLESE